MGRSRQSIKEIVVDYYALFVVEHNASHEDIKLVYRALAWEHHPDRGGNAMKMAQYTEAWAVLGDPKRRKEYDKKLSLLMSDCNQCKGTGKQRIKKGFSTVTVGDCLVCSGRGKIL